MQNDPFSYSLVTYFWVFILSIWGGIVNYLRKVNTGAIARYSLVELIGELVISGFCGVMTFYLCEASDFEGTLTAAFVGISGHMGSRGIFMIENYIQRKFDNAS